MNYFSPPSRMQALTALTLVIAALATPSWAQNCKAQSGPQITPVVELFTSEGCSSCPPADQWLSRLKQQAASRAAVVQAFHVSYWDYIGWVDRFAAPAHTQRQKQIAASQRLSSIYTPQVVLNGQDWPRWQGLQANAALGPSTNAQLSIELRSEGNNRFVAKVKPNSPSANWNAYWTVTEHGHSSKVRAGENAGELLNHDFVVRQYQSLATQQGEQQLLLQTGPALPAHPRQINLVVTEPSSGKTLQALSLQCGGNA
jgi:hypothetical protein